MNAYIRNRQENRPKFPEDREKFGTEFLDNIGDRINETAFGKFRQEGLKKQADLQKKVYESSSPLIQKAINAYTTPNRIEQNILGKISDITQIDERISTPLTYAAIGGGIKGASKLKPKHLGITQTIEPYTPPKSVGKVPRKMVNITNQVDEVFNMRPTRVQEIVRIAKKNKISYKKAEQYVNLKEQGIIPSETLNPGTNAGLLGEGASLNQIHARLIQQGKNRGMMYDKDGNPIQPKNYYGPVEETGPNYSAIEGPDFDSGKFNWLSARTGTPYHFDISGHRIFEVPGMQNDKEATRYKNWLTNSLVQRFKDQTVVPDKPITFFHSNKDFIDSKGNPWQLVRANKRAKGPNQTYIPTPKNEVDSRKMKKQNTNNEEKVLLRALMNQNVSLRNATEKKYPWLREWISEGTGQNYHEHMYGLDETEFWNSGYGKSLGYMNNDVYDVEKGLGNIVFLNDPRFKKAKDAVADIITPGKKITIYPGLRRRLGAVKRFTAGKYKGLNAIIGYDADPKSQTYTDLTIVAYDPDPNVVFGERVATIPNYYSLVFAKLNGKRLIDDKTAKGFFEQYVTAVLNDDQPKIILLTDFAEALPRIYPELRQAGLGQIPPGDFEIPEPSGLNLDPDFRSVGKYSKKDPDPDPLKLKVFKMDDALQRKRDAYMKRLLIRLKKGTYTQLDFINLLFYDD